MKTPTTTYTTAANNLLIDYNKKIDILQGNINNKQKLIESDKAAISSIKEKINVIHEVLHELNTVEANTLKAKTKDLCDLKFNDLTPQGQFNTTNTPIKPLTEEQIKKFSETFNNQKNSSKTLEDALKSIEANINKDSFCFVDVKYNDAAKWPLDL